MKNKIEDLRNYLFDTLDALKDAEDPAKLTQEIDRAKAIVSVAQTLVDTAKAENTFLELSEHARVRSSGFIPTSQIQQPQLQRISGGGRP